MSTVARPDATSQYATHEVRNQVPPLEGRNLFLDNTPLVEGLAREGGGWAHDRAVEVGAFWAGDPMTWGFEANENPPVLHTHDRYGNRSDSVAFHPAWHALMARGVHDEMHALPWNDPRPGAHVARAALYISGTQAEAGFGCPITMTFAAVPALRTTPELADEWIPRLTARGYDGALKPATEKPGAICGMAMTEKQGGSDVRANSTVAIPVNGGGEGAEYTLVGHKWFCSAPMSDVFLVLAQTDEGLSCFVVPRFLPDGTKNAGFQLQRLKDKLGNKSNASSEIELKGAWGRMLGQPGRGVPTIIEMVGHTRLDCVMGGAGGMRAAVALASWHVAHRAAFGKTLIDQPLMRNVIADLAVESEAATALTLRLCRAYDEAMAGDERADHFKRLATAVAKYHVCKRLPNHAFEALECFGGNGYVEASGMPRLYREAPLCSIWEGSGNVMALDVLRALARTPEALDVFLEELDAASGADTRYDAYIQTVRSEFARPAELEHRARLVVERMALALQASQLLRHAPAEVADAFVATRLSGDGGVHYGTLPAGTDVGKIIERHMPQVAA
ncbi:MAG TPA: acyl-CoA dehydrogenase family protein [Baekduia sp.]|uniref:acyl-CoA dehydrogenase family protein n=1 Tax=Baekduia sp. TaxID=2600305 RepID=UPI002D774608|nr:acyl-CoA dehydrogenase family protein [Baekduia sp.]HET6505227.1 acyl-CoA dehydrogenase family protein [Baekduia sp.]